MMGRTATIVVHSQSDGATAVDAEGRWSPVFTSRTIEGNVSKLQTSEEVQTANQDFERDRIIVLVDKTEVILMDDELEVSCTTPNGLLDGRYKVRGVRPNPLHVRVLCHSLASE